MLKFFLWKMLITLFILQLPGLLGITTIHHDKPENSRISKMATKMIENLPQPLVNSTLIVPERQKRLLPYINYYIDNNYSNQPPLRSSYQNHYEPEIQKPNKFIQYSQYHEQPKKHVYQNKIKFTPFLESNALPGRFTPMIKNQDNNILNYEDNASPKIPNFSTIYDNLAQLKMSQQNVIKRPIYVEKYRTNPKPKLQINYISQYNDQNQNYDNVPPAKAIIHHYTPTNIDITAPANGYNNHNYQQTSNYRHQKPFVQQNIAIEIPQGSYSPYEPIKNDQKQFYQQKQPQPVFYYRQKPTVAPEKNYIQLIPIKKPIIYIQRKPVLEKPIDDKYGPHKFPPSEEISQDELLNTQLEKYVPVEEFEPQKYQPIVNHQQEIYQTPVPVTTVQVPTENTNTLSNILKQLQESNMLPQTLTPDNIDNSIKTLVRILTSLKNQPKFSRPIVVAEDNLEEEKNAENQDDLEIEENVEELPETDVQNFPANTIEGGTPGKPGIDYPALSTIPQTTFNCKMQRYKGFFGDPDTNCQVWHYCDLNGGQASFLCPNGTIFSQVALTCDWWYNVKCSTTAQLYVLNERLYKYILPLSPKFPEDYSGPLVDKYLALKFKEMEEKVEKEKKNKEESESTTQTESDIEEEIQQSTENQ